MVRKEGGVRNMKTDRRRIDIVPLWRQQPDARLFAQAVIELARQLQLAKEQRMARPGPAKEDRQDG